MDYTSHPSISSDLDFSLDTVISAEPLKQALSQLGVFIHDKEKVLGNHLLHALGYTGQDTEFQTSWDLIHPEDRWKIESQYNEIMNGQRNVLHFSYRIRSKSGEYRWILTKGSVVHRDSDVDPVLFIGSDTDITTLKVQEEQLRKSKEEAEQRAREAEILRQTAFMISSSLDLENTLQQVMDQAHELVAFDSAFIYLNSMDIHELIIMDHVGHQIRRIPLDDDNEIQFQQIQDGGPQSGSGYITFPDWCDHLDISEFQQNKSWIYAPLSPRGMDVGAMIFQSREEQFFDIQQVRLLNAFAAHVSIAIDNAQMHESIKKMAMEDPLTGLSTRNRLNHEGQFLYSQALRHNRPLALLLADIDHFKSVNDEFGHLVGDIILAKVANLLSTSLRDIDSITRYGGEEFLIILPDTDELMAFDVAERIRMELEQLTHQEMNRPVTISIGIHAEIPTPGISIKQMIDKADQALYAAKSNGRNRVEVASG